MQAQYRKYARAAVAVGLVAAVIVAATTPCASAGEPAGWTPEIIARQNTVKLRTTGADDGEHWFPVWVVVVDNQVYVRLGSRAAGRVERNTTAPYLGVEVDGKRFDKVHGVAAPEAASRVAAAMADKYWSDVIVRHFSHPLTLRLLPE